MTYLRTLACVGAFSLAALQGARAQEPPSAGALPLFRSGADVVLVDVSVLDRDGQPVSGLTVKDFTVREDGHSRPLVAFAAIDVPPPVVSTTPWLREVRPDVITNDLAARRLVVIVMDDSTGRTEPVIVANTKLIASRVVDALGPLDMAAVVFTAGSRTQNFTDDRTRLQATVQAFTMTATAGGSSTCPARRCVTETLGRVSMALRAVPDRRKTMVYISTGGVGAAESASLQSVLRDAQWSNVTVYALDPSGLADMARIGAMPDPAAALRSLQARQDTLRALAESTGGRAFVNSNDPAASVGDIFRETRSYYLLGFQAGDGPIDGKVRRIEVSVNRRGVQVRARRGYYLEDPLAGARHAGFGTTPEDLRDILMAPVPSADVALAASAAAFASPDLRRATIAMVVGVHQPVASELATEQLRTLAAAFDEEGKAQSWRQQSLTLTLPVDADGQARYEILSRLDVPPGRYELRFALAGAAGRRPGSIHTFVDVPDYLRAALSLSGVVFESTAAPVITPLNVLEDTVPIIPTSVREFTQVDQAHAFLRVYQGGGAAPQDVHLSGQVIDSAGGVAFLQSATLNADVFKESHGGEGLFELPLATLSPGAYLFRVDASTANASVTRNVRFVMR